MVGNFLKLNSVREGAKYKNLLFNSKLTFHVSLTLSFLTKLVPKAHNSECQNLLFLFQIKPVKVNLKLNWRIFLFLHPRH